MQHKINKSNPKRKGILKLVKMKNEIHIEFSFTQNQDLKHNLYIVCKDNL